MNVEPTGHSPGEGQDSPQEGTKRPWQEPRLRFVEPMLTKHGSLEDLTTGFFGDISPRS